MTLLEALLALVILGLSAVGYLERFRGDARAVSDADVWGKAAAIAEGTMEEALLAPSDLRAEDGGRDTAYTTTVHVLPYRGRLEDVVVTVRLPDGRSMHVHRLVRRDAGSTTP